MTYYQDDQVTLHHGDCIDVLAELPDASVDSVVTDPPYGLEFMGKDWDRPWAVTPTATTGFTGRGDNFTLPSHRDNRNANCRACGGRQRGAKRCVCATPDWDRNPASDMFEFQLWCTAWAIECLRVLKPGGHLLAFGGTRTWHRLASAIEDAGFEIRDSIAWLYGSGFPKSLDVHKVMDALKWAGRVCVMCDGSGQDRIPDRVCRCCNGHGREAYTDEWQGWGTALKPAFEPIVVARKPLRGTVAANVLEHGTGAINIDACRVGTDSTRRSNTAEMGYHGGNLAPSYETGSDAGRWPTNVVIDEHTAAGIDKQSGISRDGVAIKRNKDPNANESAAIYGTYRQQPSADQTYGGEGGASRFFPTFKYQAKADTAQRPTADGITHPTVKPLDLMRWLIRLVTPPHGLVLDPFAGSGTTAEACIHEHMRCIVIEREADYLPLIVGRLTKPMAIGFDFEAGP